MLTLMQLALLLLAYLAFLGNETMELTLTERTLGLVAAVVYLPAISFLSMLIQNAGAILFPTWIRPGPERAGGVEALGQNMLLIIAHVGIITVLMAVPFGAATAVQMVLHPALAGWAEIPRAAVFLALIAFEAHVIVGWLGGVLERTDPASIGRVTPLTDASRSGRNEARAREGTKRLSAVEVMSPPRMTMAIGPSISRPGSPLPIASGRRPSAVTSAVMRIGPRRSSAPRMAVSASPGIALHRDEMIVVRDQHHRVAGGDAEERDESDQ